MSDPTIRSVELTGAEALRLLGGVSLGRIVFTRQALPTIRPVNRVLIDGDIVIRTRGDAALTRYTGHAGVKAQSWPTTSTPSAMADGAWSSPAMRGWSPIRRNWRATRPCCVPGARRGWITASVSTPIWSPGFA